MWFSRYPSWEAFAAKARASVRGWHKTRRLSTASLEGFTTNKSRCQKVKSQRTKCWSAPKSFRRFLAAKAAAESREKRREREENEQEDEPAAASGDEKSRSDGGQSSSEDEGGDEDDQRERTTDVVAPLVRAKPDQGNAKLKEMDEQAVAAATENTKKKKKYLSLRERKRKERAALRAQKEEESEFINGTGTTARFGEVAEAPPTITLGRGKVAEKAKKLFRSSSAVIKL